MNCRLEPETMPSRRRFLGGLAAGGMALLAGCELDPQRQTATPEPRSTEAFAKADRSTETSTHLESRASDGDPLLTERGIGTTLDGSDPDDHWTFIDTPSHLDELDGAVSAQSWTLLETVDLDRAFVFVYQVRNDVPGSVTEILATGTYRDRFYFHLAWDDDATRLSAPTVKTWFVVVPGDLPSQSVLLVTYTLGWEW